MQGDRIVDAARECLGTPWVHQARVRGEGLDCVGLLVDSVNRAGGAVHDVANYPRQSGGGHWLLAQLRLQFDPVARDALRLGDVLAFQWAVAPWHVGIVSSLEPLAMIHSWVQVGACVEMKLNDVWRRRIHSAWRARPPINNHTSAEIA